MGHNLGNLKTQIQSLFHFPKIQTPGFGRLGNGARHALQECPELTFTYDPEAENFTATISDGTIESQNETDQNHSQYYVSGDGERNRKRGDDLASVEYLQKVDPEIERKKMKATLDAALNKI